MHPEELMKPDLLSEIVLLTFGTLILSSLVLFLAAAFARARRSQVHLGQIMTPTLQVGTILIEDRPRIMQFLGLESDPYTGGWSVVRGLDGFGLDRKIHAAGWNFFFMAAEVKLTFLGSLGTAKIQNAMRRILAQVRPQSFNCLEVTGIVAKRFLGMRYATVSAHPRHIQPSCCLDGASIRRASQLDAEWANG
jgi:hypothetical protein